MIPNIRNGHSFRGAGQYYLHDKAPEREKGKGRPDHPASSDRVAWTRTLNCVNDDPELALKEMIAVAEAQEWLKEKAGVEPGGRRTGLSVKTVSLSWHPDEQPSREDMEEAALSYLQRMGWQEHQTLLVAHNDTPHDHVHLIINRIHPETGRTLNDWQDERRSQQWALEYEREHGRVWCEAREEKYQAERGIDPGALAHELAINMRDASHPQSDGRDNAETWQDLIDRQRAERIGFFEEGRAEFRALRQEVFREVRDDFKPLWHGHYAWAKEQEQAVQEAHGLARALQFAREGDFAKGLDALKDRDERLAVVRDEIADAQAELSALQKRITKELQDQAIDIRLEERDSIYQDLLAEQRDERRQFKLFEQTDGRATWHRAWEPYRTEEAPANDNRASANIEPVDSGPRSAEAVQTSLSGPSMVLETFEGSEERSWHRGPDEEGGANFVTSAADFGADAIGSLAGYLADQMAELFAPTPPEVREAQARAADREDSARQEAAERTRFNAYARAAEAAVRRAEEERETERNRTYWEERERQRDGR